MYSTLVKKVSKKDKQFVVYNWSKFIETVKYSYFRHLLKSVENVIMLLYPARELIKNP